MLTHKQIPAAEKPPRWSTTGGGAGGGFLKSRLPIDQMIQIRFSRLGRVRGADKAGGSWRCSEVDWPCFVPPLSVRARVRARAPLGRLGVSTVRFGADARRGFTEGDACFWTLRVGWGSWAVPQLATTTLQRPSDPSTCSAGSSARKVSLSKGSR
jgi:hypothetical protein